MADKKISQLTDGTSLQSGDSLVVARSGNNFKVDPTQFGSSIDVTGTVTADGLSVDTGGSAVEFNHSATGPTLRFNNTDLTPADGQQLARIEFSTDDAGVTTDEVYLQITGDGTGGAAFFDIMTGDGTPTKTARFNVGGDISFYEDTGTTPKFFWDASAESLGIGTNSPTNLLTVQRNDTVGVISKFQSGTVNGQHLSISSTSTGVQISSGFSTGIPGSFDIASGGGNSYITLSSAGSEAMRIDSSGNVGIGTTSPDATLTVAGGGVAEFRAGNIGPSNNSAIRVSRNDTSVTTGNPLGYLEFGGNDSTSNVDTAFAYVGAEASGPHAAGDNPTDLVFGVTADDSGTPAEAMRIDSSGNVGIGTSSPDGTLHVFAGNNYNGTDFVDAPHALLDNGTITNHTAVLVFNSSGVSEANKKSGITGGNYFNELHGLGLFGDISGKDRSATPDVFINDSGNVGIGTSSPNAQLQLTGDIWTGAGTSASPGIKVGDGNTGFYYVGGNVLGVTTNGIERMRIDASGNLLVGTTTSPSDTGTIVADGIYLGGTGAANLLDDYEEGTWTPTFEPATGAFGAITYDAQIAGRYVKVGQIVHVSGILFTDAITIGTASGDLRIGGLPFTVSNDPSSQHMHSGVVGTSADWGTNHPQSLLALRNTTTANMYYWSGSGAAGANIQASDLATGANDNVVYFSISYRVA